MQSPEQFYDDWASKQLLDKKRDNILKWKAVNFLNLLLRNGHNRFERVSEIGGAEGILLNTLDQVISIENLINYDISSNFCTAGKKRFEKITFINQDFIQNPSFYDLILLSDIIEHVENDDEFLRTVSKYCKYLLIKVPIERSLINSSLFYAITLRKKPLNLRFGSTHINGHLRGYTVNDARKLLLKHFQIIDHELSDVAYFNNSMKKVRHKNIFGKQIFIRIYGGAYFVLCRSHFKP